MAEKIKARVIVEAPGVEIATFLDDYEEIEYSEDILEEDYGKLSANTKKIIEDNAEFNKVLVQEALKNAEFNLEDALDSYDPTFARYTPSKEAFEFFNLMRLVEGGDFEFDTPIAHYFMVDLLLNNISDPMMFPYSIEICMHIEINHLRLAFMCSRGMAKSSVVISFFGVYSAIKGTLPNGIGKVWFYLVLAASSRGGARVNALAVRAMCEESAFLLDYFEEMRFTETESEFVRRGEGPRKDRAFLIRYQGVGTGVRGIRYGQRRICTIINDDIILNEAAAYSKRITENLESVIHSDSVAALKGGGKGRILNCFTPFSYSDVNTRLVLSGAYTPCVIPIANSFDEEREDLRTKDITSTWEAYHPSKSILTLIKDAKKTNTLSKFMQERMLRLTSGTDRLIPDHCIQFCDMKVIENNLDGYNIYITTDYTTTSGEKSDFSGIATWAVNSNEDAFLLNLHLRKMGMETQYAVTLEQAAKYKRKGKNVEIGVEVDGNQSAHLLALEKRMREQGTYYSFAKQKGQLDSTRKGILSKSTGVNKHERFRIASHAFLQGKIWLPQHLANTPDMKEFMSQIKGATHEAFTRSDDGPDLVTMLIVSMHVHYPTHEAVHVNKDTHYYGTAGRADYTSGSAYDSY
jgi:hypothetical protein